MTIVYTLLAAIGIAIAILLALYFFTPRMLFNAFRKGLRRRAKLTLKSVEVNGQVWPYLERGPAGGVPVVLLHGFGGDKDNWALYAKEMPEKYRVIAPDLPGFGENIRDTEKDYGIALQSERVLGFLDALGIEKCHLGGNSMGGFIALQFAFDHPDRLHSLTLFNNAGVLGTEESHLQKEVSAGKNPLLINSADDVQRMMAYIAHKPLPVPGRFRQVIYDEFAPHRDLLDKIFWQIGEDALNKPLNGKLPDLKTPTMIIWGKHDQLIDVSCAEVLDNGIPVTEKVVFDDMGHVPMVENPPKVAKRHLPFLAKH